MQRCSRLTTETEQPQEKRVMTIASEDKEFSIDADAKTFGSTSTIFTDGLIMQLANIGSKGPKVDADGTAFVASIVAGVKPRDELESMLAAQMAAIHNATMTFARRLSHVENIPQQDSAERALNKLARTYVLQMQALQKYRSGGKQKVVVKHVHVNQGGQAVVGNVEHKGEVG